MKNWNVLLGILCGESVTHERVAKIMAQRGLCSRREAERLISEGLVVVDGVVVRQQGQKADVQAEISIASAGRERLAENLTVVLHKPIGIVSTQPQGDQVPAWKLLRADTADGPIPPPVLERIVSTPQTLAVAGRLDRGSRGLLLLTQDGTIAKQLVGGRGLTKTYLVRTVEPIRPEHVRKLRGPLQLDGRKLLPMVVDRTGEHGLRFVLVEGRKHQIRRVCRRVGLEVADLFRSAIGGIEIGSLSEGHWRLVRPDELQQLRTVGNQRIAQRVGG